MPMKWILRKRTQSREVEGIVRVNRSAFTCCCELKSSWTLLRGADLSVPTKPTLARRMIEPAEVPRKVILLRRYGWLLYQLESLLGGFLLECGLL